MTAKKMIVVGAKPYYVKMEEVYCEGINKRYVFRIDLDSRKVIGVLNATYGEPNPYPTFTSYRHPLTQKTVRKVNADHVVTQVRHPKIKASVTCSPRDNWDPLVGIAVCKLKLDVKLAADSGANINWKLFKEQVKH